MTDIRDTLYYEMKAASLLGKHKQAKMFAAAIEEIDRLRFQLADLGQEVDCAWSVAGDALGLGCDHDWFDCSNANIQDTKSCRKCGWTCGTASEDRGLYIKWPWMKETADG
ncbi:hypothetical protein DEM27_10265 [Metarhizobium album]|uniref:Uncharacterized protein n=1 Tax=Metarhizobium album TaxID=2182425 RepID=A0A2U2DTV0_9HYPH|nr:hypothetical protein [Rhizobium album]PWE56738.1 hypothetical protein DEM27_10265 [Rhizobium album]